MQLMFKLPAPRAPRLPIRRATGALAMLTLVCGALFAAAPPAEAQGLFAAAIRVNGRVITTFELEQRQQFLRLIRAPGDPVKQARQDLIDDRLKQSLIDEAGIELADEDINQGMADFAKRVNLSTEDFVKALEAGGVSRETFRDFIKVQLGWEEYVRNRFLAVARPSDSEIDRAFGEQGAGGGVRVLLSEIIIPVTPQTLDAIEAEAARISQIRDFDAFSAEAERFSASETRDRGGRMDWLALNKLPPALRPLILALNPGEVTAPIALPKAVALFQMRDIQETRVPPPTYARIDYAILYVEGGRAPETLQYAESIRGIANTCKDLYGIAHGYDPKALDMRSEAPAKIPRDIARELAKLDNGEISTALTTPDGQRLMLLMMCGRTAAANNDTSRQDIGLALTQQRLNAIADSELTRLRSEAIIDEK